MKLSVAAAMKLPGEPFPFAFFEPVAPMEFQGRALIFPEAVKVSGAYVFEGKAFTLTGDIKAVMQSTCARCTEPFLEPLAFSFQERFVKAAAEEDSYAYEGDTLDISQMVLDNLLLHLPIVSVCHAGCKGLCPVCGCNLNTAQCSCEAGSVKPEHPFHALQALRTDGEEV